MAAGDHAGLIEACARLGVVSRGGDPHLWTEVLQYFGSQNYDCSAQVTPQARPCLHQTCLLRSFTDVQTLRRCHRARTVLKALSAKIVELYASEGFRSYYSFLSISRAFIRHRQSYVPCSPLVP